MFPALKTTVSGLEPQSKYFILLDLCLADDSRYKWTGSEWQVGFYYLSRHCVINLVRYHTKLYDLSDSISGKIV
jgi:hypothetical protein